MMTDRLLYRLTQIPGVRSLWGRFPLGSLDLRVHYGIFEMPHYAYGVYSAADLANRLGLDAISVIEFGVAGGRGLLALERIARAVARRFGVRIHVTGFDSGQGMPPPLDYRDLPHIWDQGFYRMDVPRLKARLSPDTELILGDAGQTVPAWVPKAPIGFIAFDLDYYSSTIQAFRVFESEQRLPRIYCYFDDILGQEQACHNDHVGDLCAIREFNERHARRKICPIHMFGYTRPHPAAWHEQMYVMHDFEHPLYCRNLTPAGGRHTQLPL